MICYYSYIGNKKDALLTKTETDIGKLKAAMETVKAKLDETEQRKTDINKQISEQKVMMSDVLSKFGSIGSLVVASPVQVNL